MQCKHEEFEADCKIQRLTGSDKVEVTDFVLEVSIRCAECGKPFQFVGLPPGTDTQGIGVSLDGLKFVGRKFGSV